MKVSDMLDENLLFYFCCGFAIAVLIAGASLYAIVDIDDMFVVGNFNFYVEEFNLVELSTIFN